MNQFFNLLIYGETRLKKAGFFNNLKPAVAGFYALVAHQQTNELAFFQQFSRTLSQQGCSRYKHILIKIEAGIMMPGSQVGSHH